MKWTVAGVITVFLVQAGFIAYTSLERRSNELIAMNGIPAAAEDLPIALINEIEPEPSFAGTTNDENSDDAVRISDRRNISGSTESRYPAAKKAKNFVNTTTATFNHVVIVVPKYSAPKQVPVISPDPEPGTKEYQAYTKQYPRPVKRSFASKTVSVLKKPYDWVKALGSRMM